MVETSIMRAACSSHQGEEKDVSSGTALPTSLISDMAVDFRLDTAALAESQNVFFFFFCWGKCKSSSRAKTSGCRVCFGVRPDGMWHNWKDTAKHQGVSGTLNKPITYVNICMKTLVIKKMKSKRINSKFIIVKGNDYNNILTHDWHLLLVDANIFEWQVLSITIRMSMKGKQSNAFT